MRSRVGHPGGLNVLQHLGRAVTPETAETGWYAVGVAGKEGGFLVVLGLERGPRFREQGLAVLTKARQIATYLARRVILRPILAAEPFRIMEKLLRLAEVALFH